MRDTTPRPPSERSGQPRSRAGEPLRSVRVLGLGAHVPERALTNTDLEGLVDTSDEWIVARTGIRERRIVAEGEATSDLAIAAARAALAQARLDPADVELIVLATATPDQPTPSTAAHVQHRLGAVRAAGFDVSSACAGFVHALATAHHMIAGGGVANALVIGADALSRITDYQDRGTCILLGDGAGALVLSAGDGGGELLDHVLGLDGSRADLIEIPSGGSRRPASAATVAAREHYLRMRGQEVFKFAVTKVCDLVNQLAERHGLAVGDFDLVVPHQANARILDAAARVLGLDPARVVVDIERRGNTSNGSIPLALDAAVRDGRLRPGHLVLLASFGGGMSWGASLLRW